VGGSERVERVSEIPRSVGNIGVVLDVARAARRPRRGGFPRAAVGSG
jgi:predicted Rdx family selenoprotein